MIAHDENDDSVEGIDSMGEFTEVAYRGLIKLAKARYKFVSIEELRGNGYRVFWRHDVDISPQRAHALARIENEENVSATYFFLLGSEFYNLFEKCNTHLVKEVAKLGHNVGLHFDCNRYDVQSESDLVRWIVYEKGVLSELLDIDVTAVSFHNPSTVGIDYRSEEYCGLRNAYSESLMRDAKYVSDSNGIWRYGHLRETLALAEHRRLQVLTHPVWWQNREMTPDERVRRCIDGRAEATYRDYKRILRNTGRVPTE